MPRILAECGIRYVIVESLPSAKIDGVCFWLNEVSPVIGMSLRYDRIDNFWLFCAMRWSMFYAFTEPQGWILHRTRGGTGRHGSNISDEERIANEAAADFCVPRSKDARFVARKSPFFAEKDVIRFARTLGVHPGLVAGQLQNHTGRFDRFRNHLEKIRSIVAPSAMAAMVGCLGFLRWDISERRKMATESQRLQRIMPVQANKRAKKSWTCTSWRSSPRARAGPCQSPATRSNLGEEISSGSARRSGTTKARAVRIAPIIRTRLQRAVNNCIYGSISTKRPGHLCSDFSVF